MRIGLFIIPGFGLMAYAGVTEVIFQANKHIKPGDITWETVAPAAELVVASCGTGVMSSCGIEDAPFYDWIIIFGSRGAPHFNDKKVFNWLRQAARYGTRLGAVTSGAWVLARAGLLTGYQCTLHWRDIEAFRETYPKIEVKEDIYVIDGARFSCAGGETAANMIMQLLITQFGPGVVQRVSETLMHERIRNAEDKQRNALKHRIHSSNKTLLKFVSELEKPSNEPDRIIDLCNRIGISRRRLEQLFQQHLRISPKQYQLNARLLRTRDLLLTTEMSIREISVIAGFSSPPHFTTAFKRRFNTSPSSMRRYDET